MTRCRATQSVVSSAATVIGNTATSASNPDRGPSSASTRRNAGSARRPVTKRRRGGREISDMARLPPKPLPGREPEQCRDRPVNASHQHKKNHRVPVCSYVQHLALLARGGLNVVVPVVVIRPWAGHQPPPRLNRV